MVILEMELTYKLLYKPTVVALEIGFDPLGITVTIGDVTFDYCSCYNEEILDITYRYGGEKVTFRIRDVEEINKFFDWLCHIMNNSYVE